MKKQYIRIQLKPMAFFVEATILNGSVSVGGGTTNEQKARENSKDGSISILPPLDFDYDL